MFMQRNVAYLLLIVMLGLIALGLVMLSSTSAVLAPQDSMTNVYSNLRKQFAWLVLGGVACVFFSRFDYQKLLRCAPWLAGVACLLLLLCLIPPFGHKVNGSPRWLEVKTYTYQPSEFAKLALIIFLSWWMGKYQRHVRDFMKGLFWPIACVSPLLYLMIRQQDFGTTAIMLAILVAILFCAGSRLRYLIPLPIIGVAGILAIASFNPERWARMTAFWYSEHTTDPKLLEKLWQQKQALIALGSGGVSGLGLGNSIQKMYYLPEVNTDFVFPIIGEELGMWVTLSIVLAFLLLVLCSGWITIHAPDPGGVFLGTGITVMVGLQVLMNLAVVTSLMPCKGISLPFISYGGSNLLTCMAAVGILFNMHRQGIYHEAQPTKPSTPKSYSVRM
jgi:cell division protein FtsW